MEDTVKGLLQEKLVPSAYKRLTVEDIRNAFMDIYKLGQPPRIWHATYGEIKWLLEMGGLNAIEACVRANRYEQIIMGSVSLKLIQDEEAKQV